MDRRECRTATKPVKTPIESPDGAQEPYFDFLVVGIGASAGGLEAVTELIGAIPESPEMAFVFVQHLSPDRESLVADLLARKSPIPVLQIDDGMPVEKNHFYVIRPGYTLTVDGGVFRLGEPLAARGHGRPVDDLFRSLADVQRERAISIILSGMGSNGTAGCQAIKAVGGFCIAQDTQTAKYPSMPRHLIDSGYADTILRPVDMPEALRRYARHPYARREPCTVDQDMAQPYREIMSVLKARTKLDFTGYKKPTILRRIQRRMSVMQTDRISDYVQMLRQNPSEATALADDKADSHYCIKKELREMVVFAPQNVLQDPPFSKIDICTCRNFLIYLEPEMQRRVLLLLHFGLHDGGALFLGSSESVGGDGEDLFETVDKRNRIFRRIGPTRHGSFEFFRSSSLSAPERLTPESTAQVKASIPHLARRVLLEQHSPAAVVIDRSGRILFFHGNSERYLIQPAGEPARDLVTLSRDGVRAAARVAMQRALTEESAKACAESLFDAPEGRARVTVCVSTLPGAPDYLLAVFTDHPETTPEFFGDADGDRSMRDELIRTKDELQSTVEELQTANEELKASHEEVTSVNEELQSTNEELETSKEELQSLNEELTTVNAQLQAKMSELEGTSNDLASLLASTDIAVVFLDTKFRIRRFTPAVRDLFELLPADVGRPLSDLAKKFTDPNLLVDTNAVLDRLAPVAREVVSNTGRWYLRRALPYRTTDNRIGGVVLTFVDITERQLAAKEREAILVREQRAREAAETASQMKDSFLNTVSHELRTPLTTIMIWSNLLRSYPQEPERHAEGLEAIDTSAKVQKRIIDDLLDTARIASGKLRLSTHEVDLVDLIEEVVDSSAKQAEEASVRLISDLAPDLGVVLADAGRLRQVLGNLVENAVKFSSAGDEVEVSAHREGPIVKIQVRDQGIGIPATFLEKLFKQFKQADSGTTRRHSGLGLGLSIARQLVELHGGTIEASSAGEGKGSTFEVRLPLPLLNPELLEKKASKRRSPPEPGLLRGVSVLLVDNDEATLNAAHALLHAHGATAATAKSATEALQLLQHAVPDIIISDIGMPEVDGFGFIHRVREIGRQSGIRPIPAIALTAYARASDRDMVLSAGFSEYLSKPIEPEQLTAVILRLAHQE